MRIVVEIIDKLSSKKATQKRLIKLGVIPWIFSNLQNSDSLDDHILEDLTDLLMNLTLRKEGKIACQNPKLNALKILISLLEKHNPQIQTHVNGTLYSLLNSATIRDEAKVTK